METQEAVRLAAAAGKAAQRARKALEKDGISLDGETCMGLMTLAASGALSAKGISLPDFLAVAQVAWELAEDVEKTFGPRLGS